MSAEIFPQFFDTTKLFSDGNIVGKKIYHLLKMWFIIYLYLFFSSEKYKFLTLYCTQGNQDEYIEIFKIRRKTIKIKLNLIIIFFVFN